MQPVWMEAQPSSSWKKGRIVSWLRDNNIEHSDKWLKNELLALARKHRKAPMYIADEEARKRGHIVLRLPPYHCQYNAIELAWGLMKRHYDKHIKEYGRFTEENCLNVWKNAIDLITPEVWRKIVEKVDKIILADWKSEGGLIDADKTDYSKMVFNVQSSTSESEFDFLEYDDECDAGIRQHFTSQLALTSKGPVQESLPPKVKKENTELQQSVPVCRRALFSKEQQVDQKRMKIDLGPLEKMRLTKALPRVEVDNEVKISNNIDEVDLTSQKGGDELDESAPECRRALFSTEQQDVQTRTKMNLGPLEEMQLTKAYPKVEMDSEVVEICNKIDEVDITSQDNLWHESLLPPVHPDYEVVAEGFNYRILNRDIRTLDGRNHLNDEVINVYLKLVEQEAYRNGVPVFAFSTFFYPRLTAGSHFAVSRHTKKVNIFSMRYVLIPVHIVIAPCNHWALCIVDCAKKEVRYCDSARISGRFHLQTILAYLRDEAAALKIPFNDGEWGLKTVKDLPTQTNGDDCGAFMCHFAYLASLEKDFSFCADDIPQIRKDIKEAILRMSLRSECSLGISAVPSFAKESKSAVRRRNVSCITGMSPKKEKNRSSKKMDCAPLLKVPKFRREADGGKFTATDGVYLVVSAHVHQRSQQFSDGENQQSVVMSLYALVTALRLGSELTTMHLDTIVYSAHGQFMQLRQKGFSPMDLPVCITVGERRTSLKYTTIIQGNYNDNQRIALFAGSVDTAMRNINHEESFGFVVIGHFRCFAFWPSKNSKFYFFNSHCVDVNNLTVCNAKRGAARLFECQSSQSLAEITFKNDVRDDAPWVMVKVFMSES